MPYDIAWYVDQHIIFERFHGVVPIEDINAITHDAQPFLDASDADRVHFLIDARDVESFQLSVFDMKKAKFPPITSKIGAVILIGGHSKIKQQFIRFIGIAVEQIFRLQLRVVETIEEAEKTLIEIDSSLESRLAAKKITEKAE